MKAVRIHFSDELEHTTYVNHRHELVVDDIPRPQASADEVVVRTQAIGLNRADLYRRRTVLQGQQEPPRTLGLDVAGTVDSVGENVTKWNLGDQVIGLVRGAYAEYVAGHANLIYSVPEGMSVTDAASIPCVFLTAWYAFKMAGLKPGDTALIHAAGSGVGMAGIQVAKKLGARVLTSAGSDSRVDLGCKLGAEAGINYSNQSVDKELLRLTNGRGADMVLDTVGGAIFDATLKALAPGGHVVTVGGHSGERSEYDTQMMEKNGQWVKPMGVFNEAQADEEQVGWNQLKTWFENGSIRTIVQQVIPWPEAQRAQDILNSRQIFGKVVLQI